MSHVEYYFQTTNPIALAQSLRESLGYMVVLHPAEFETQTDRPDVADLKNWYRVDSFELWMSNEHLEEVSKIRKLTSYYDDIVESHDSIMDAFWALGQGLD